MENLGQKVKRHNIKDGGLRRAETSKCLGGCEGDFLKFANDNLNRNNISRVHFSGAIITALVATRNCGKTLILKNLCQNFGTHLNVSTKSFA